jgi:hypothetical protein
MSAPLSINNSATCSRPENIQINNRQFYKSKNLNIYTKICTFGIKKIVKETSKLKLVYVCNDNRFHLNEDST